MQQLREMIRKFILENYEITDTDIERLRGWNYGYGQSDEQIRQTVDHRGVGAQNKSAIKRDKQAMRDWHQLMKKNPDFVKQFMQGKVHILHSISYEGTYSSKI